MLIVGSHIKLNVGDKVKGAYDAHYTYHDNIAMVIIREATLEEWLDSIVEHGGTRESGMLYLENSRHMWTGFYAVLAD